MLNIELGQQIEQLLSAHKLPRSYWLGAEPYLYSLARNVAAAQTSKRGIYVLGVNGAQGTGKTTLSEFLKLILRAEYKKRCIVLSLDNFYYSNAERIKLARDTHPLLRTRGVPGTHDVALAVSTIASLLNDETVPLPHFDKGMDDRLPVECWPVQTQAVDIILFEGWCVGAKPQSGQQLNLAVNSLEADEDTQGDWRRYVNDCLTGSYSHLFEYIDQLLMLKAPDLPTVIGWRGLQEKKLAESGAQNVMTAAELTRFVQHYERLTRHMLDEMPNRADGVLNLAENHTFISAAGCLFSNT